MPDESRIKFGEPLPDFLFKPREYIINAHWAEKLRQGQCTQKQFESMKLLVVEVGIDSKTGIEGYRLLSHLPGVIRSPLKMIVQWHLKIYVESNFEHCDPSSDLSF
jgi:hypothetical protein